MKEYQLKDHDKIITRKKICSNSRHETDTKFRLICKTRSRNRQTLNGKSVSISTKEILGIDIDTYRKRMRYQMTPEMNWFNIEIDHVKPIWRSDASRHAELKKAFNWENTQPLLRIDHQHKERKFNLLDYQLQFIKAYQILKLNKKR